MDLCAPAHPRVATRRTWSGGPVDTASIVSLVSSATTACPGCGRATRTVFGRCPQCGFGKEARRAGTTLRTLRGGSFWDDLGIGLAVATVLLPCLALAAAVLLFALGVELVVVAAVVALLVLLALGLAALA
jgi:ribosomal protein L37E